MKMGYIFAAVAALFFLALSQSYGSEYHHSQPIMPSNTTNIYSSKGIALGIAAAQHHFTSSTTDTQVSVAIGSYGASSALSFGFAKKFKQSLISGSVSKEEGNLGLGMSLGFKF